MFDKITEAEDRDELVKVIRKRLSKQNYKAAAYLLKKEFLEKSKKLVLYGAGLHTKRILEDLSEKDKKNIAGVVDSNKSGSVIEGFLVVDIDELKNTNFDFIILSSDIHQKNMSDELMSLGLDKEKLIDMYDSKLFLEYALYDVFDQTEQLAKTINNSKNPLIFLATSYQLNHIGLFEELAKHTDLFIFSESDKVSRSIQIESASESLKIHKLSNLKEALYLTSLIIKGKIITVHGCRDNNFPAAILAYANVPVYCMAIDVLSSMFDDANNAQKMLGDDAEEEFFCEKICWKYSSGYIHKDHKAVLSALKDRYGDKRALHFIFYTSGKSTQEYPEYKRAKPLKIAYIGGIHAIKDQNDGSVIHKSFMDVIKMATGQGYELHAYNAYDDGTTDKWDEYVDESRENTRFFYYLAVSPEELHEKLQKYDVALSVFDYSGRITKEDFHKYGFSTRIVPFIEAGIPIINSRELEYTVKLIEDFGIGIGIQFDELPNLPKVIKKMDLEKCRKNMASAKEALSYKINIHKLISFIECENAK